MKFDRSTEADEAIKNYAKKKAGRKARELGAKAGSAAAKGTIKSVKWFWRLLAGVIGTQAALCILIAVIVLLVLPSVIFSSTVGSDNKYTDDNDINATGSRWEDDAQQVLTDRFSQLTTVTFWDDLSTFFSTGHWGNATRLFKTDYAAANDLDEDGQSVSAGYFSSSNRLVSIINETFRSSLRDTASFSSPAMGQARAMAYSMETAYTADAPTVVPPTGADDYVVEFEIAKDPNIETQNFIYEACYLLSAASSAVTSDDSFANGVKEVLDLAFSVTGLDGVGGREICWEPVVISKYASRDEEYIKEVVYVTVYDHFNDLGEFMYTADHNKMGEDPAVDYVLPRSQFDHNVMGIRRTVTVTAVYSVALKNDYKDIIDVACNVETVLPADAAAYEITEKEQVELSATEILKFYGQGGFAELGDIGLPLPAASYRITSRYELRTIPELGIINELHEAWDLSAPMGTPIYAVKAGVVTIRPFDADGYGYYVTITHENGMKTRYAHMSAVYVSDGDSVEIGQQIGAVGSTGASTGPHLHFEVIDVDGTKLDPQYTDVGIQIEANKQ